MTIEELLAREGIRHTLASYNMAGDRARAEDFSAVFTEDGILETSAFRHEGRQAIRDWMDGVRAPSADAPSFPSAKFVRHNLTTCQIEMTGPETAAARTYFVVFTDIGPDHCGYYVDTFRKVGARWLIAHRKARTDWTSPNSKFRAAGT
ncbi:MAG: nuclear transport factor 2 family protein [Rhizomicrobium sp.]